MNRARVDWDAMKASGALFDPAKIMFAAEQHGTGTERPPEGLGQGHRDIKMWRSENKSLVKAGTIGRFALSFSK